MAPVAALGAGEAGRGQQAAQEWGTISPFLSNIASLQDEEAHVLLYLLILKELFVPRDPRKLLIRMRQTQLGTEDTSNVQSV